MTWIQSCAAPDLGALRTAVIGRYFLNITFLGRGGHDNPQVRSYVHAFILSVDKSVRAYNLGREKFMEYIGSENRTLLLLHGLAEFETCITTVCRSLRLVDRMATHPENPEIERSLRKLLRSYRGSVTPVRDAIEHIDADIARGETKPGNPLLLAVSRDGQFLEIGAERLSLVQLAKCLERIHKLALALATRDASVARAQGVGRKRR